MRLSLSLLLVFLCVWFSGLIEARVYHVEGQDSVAWTVNRASVDLYTGQVWTADKTVVCEVEFMSAHKDVVYVSDTAEILKETRNDGDRIDFDAFVASLANTCASTLSAHNAEWEFKVCFADHYDEGALVLQTHIGSGDAFLLGKKQETKGLSVVYKEGLFCANTEVNAPREAEVVFSCMEGDAGDIMRVIATSEPSICKYTLSVTTNKVCGDDRFETVDSLVVEAFQAAIADEQVQDPREVETWVFSAVAYEDGGYHCELRAPYGVGSDAQGYALVDLDLTVRSTQDDTPTGDPIVQAYAPPRQRIPTAVLQRGLAITKHLSTNSATGSFQETNLQDHKGALDNFVMLRVQLSPVSSTATA